MGYAGISILRTIDQMASEICGVQNGLKLGQTLYHQSRDSWEEDVDQVHGGPKSTSLGSFNAYPQHTSGP